MEQGTRNAHDQSGLTLLSVRTLTVSRGRFERGCELDYVSITGVSYKTMRRLTCGLLPLAQYPSWQRPANWNPKGLGFESHVSQRIFQFMAKCKEHIVCFLLEWCFIISVEVPTDHFLLRCTSFVAGPSEYEL